MFTHILIPVDGSPCGDQAAEVGLHLARQLNARVQFVHVHSPTSQPTASSSDDVQNIDTSGLALLQIWEQTARARGLLVRTQSIAGANVAETIKLLVESKQCDLIVMGTYCAGWLARFFLGRTAKEVLRRTPVPLMLVRYQTKVSQDVQRFQHILAPVDGSVVSLQALEWVRSIAQSLDAEVVVSHATTQEAAHHGQLIVEEALKRLDYPKSRGLLEKSEGSLVRDTISRIANEHSNLVVMGTHGRTGLSELLLGSVAEQVARQSLVPVILIPPAALGKTPARE